MSTSRCPNVTRQVVRILAGAGLAVATLGSTSALAGWPDDVRLSQLSTYEGENFTNVAANRDAYEQVVRELAAVVANKASAPAATSSRTRRAARRRGSARAAPRR